MKVRLWQVLVAGLAILSLAACTQAKPARGTPAGEALAVTAKQVIDDSSQYTGRLVSLTGKIVVECTQGCWFFLDDGTARIYVDLKPASLTIPQKIGSQATVVGHIKGKGGNVQILGEAVTFPE